MRLTKSIYLLSGASYGVMGNVYAIQTKQSLLLIDSGQHMNCAAIEKNIRYWSLEHLPVRYLLLTHTHHDHAGGAKYFQDRGAQVICSAGDAKDLEKGGFSQDEFPALGYGYPPCVPDRTISGDGEMVLDGILIQYYHVPGHSPGSTVYAYRDGEQLIFFTGDFVACEGIEGESVITGWKGDLQHNSMDYLRSARKMFRLEPDLILGGHGIPCFGGGNRVLRKLYETLLIETPRSTF